MEFLSSDECCFKGINSIMYSIYSAYLRMYVHVHMICVYIYISCISLYRSYIHAIFQKSFIDVSKEYTNKSKYVSRNEKVGFIERRHHQK